MRALLASGVVLAGCAATAVAVGAVPFHGHVSKYAGYATTGQVAIAGAPGRAGVVRARYVLPAGWHRLGTVDARRIRFDVPNSCHHRVAFAARLVQAADVGAAERARALLPAAPAYVEGSGTREAAAFRVVRTRGSVDVTGVLVQPLPARPPSAPAPGQRLFAELEATATAPPGTRCHSGGPRLVASAIADAFGAGSVGGFALAP